MKALIVPRDKGAVVQPEPLRRVDALKFEAGNFRASGRSQTMRCGFGLHEP